MVKKLFTQIVLASVLLSSSVFFSGTAQAQNVNNNTQACQYGEVVQNPSSISTEEKAKFPEIQSFIDAQSTATNSNKTFNDILIKKVCTGASGQSITSYQRVTSNAQGRIEALPTLFTTKKSDGEPICKRTANSVTCNTSGVEQFASQLRLPTCELFEQAVTTKAEGTQLGDDLKTRACTELLDPLPPEYFGGDVICVQKKTTYDAKQNPTSLELTFAPASPESGYCAAVLTTTGTTFSGLFGIVRLLYDIALPILIALAVISLVGVGVFIMYAPGGGEETMKQAKTMGVRIGMGLMLLLFLRVFLGLISTDFFGPESASTPAPTGSSTAIISHTTLI